MNHGRIVFAQVMDFFPRRRFTACVNRYRGNHRVRSFSCLDQFYCMAFAQLTGRESLRDIEACLRAVGPKLYHAGLQSRVSRNTSGQSQRDTRLANLPRHRADPHRSGPQALRPSTPGHESQASRLRPRFHSRGPVPDAVSVGTASTSQKCCEDPYATGPANQHSGVYPHYRRSGARYSFSRSCDFRARSLLYHGQGLHRFSSSVSCPSAAVLLCHTVQKQPGLCSYRFASGGQDPRSSLRSDYPSDSVPRARTTIPSPCGASTMSIPS